MSSVTNQYIRQVVHHHEAPPPAAAHFFYTSTLAIDDPLSPLPAPAATGSVATRLPHPFSQYDNDALDKTWHELRSNILKYNEEQGEKAKVQHSEVSSHTEEQSRTISKGKGRTKALKVGRPASRSDASTRDRFAATALHGEPSDFGPSRSWNDNTDFKSSLGALDGPALPADVEESNTTGNPFIRAPSRRHVPTLTSSRESSRPIRPEPHLLDSYNWDDRSALPGLDREDRPKPQRKETQRPTAKVAVGVSRLHHVVMPDLQMVPIYWHPVNDTAPVVRATWFYKDTMLPVETPVANMLELGYVELRPWTETWRDELNSAVEVGAAGEMKIIHRLWPEPLRTKDSSRPATAIGEMVDHQVMSTPELDTSESEEIRAVEAACDLIDISTGAGGPDNKTSGTALYGYGGTLRSYSTAGVIYANDKEAHILKPNLQPSTYYGRRPLANYIRKGRKLGIPVVRGFDQGAWDRLHPPKTGATMKKAQQGVSSSQSGVSPNKRAKSDAELALSERPQVTDLVFVVHGIGQKLSERMESFHFTHAINTFRREVNVELGTDGIKGQLRKDMGGIMVLPVCLLLFPTGGRN